MRQDRELEQEWLRQNSLGYAGLIAIGLVMVQAFLAAAPAGDGVVRLPAMASCASRQVRP